MIRSFLDISVYHMLWYFIIYSISGWIMETIRVSYRQGRFVNRGFLHGTYCPIYGFGMCAIIIVLMPLRNHVMLIFIVGIVLATLLEYFTSWILEAVFHARWWDYRDRRYNINGRICLTISLAWGILSIIIIKGVHPFVERLIDWITHETGVIILGTVYSIIIIDLIYSLIGAFHLSSKIKVLDAIKSELNVLMHNNSFHERIDELVLKYNQTVGSIHLHNLRLLKAFPNIIKSKAIHRLSNIKDILNGKIK